MTVRDYQEFVRANWNRRRGMEVDQTGMSFGALRNLFIMALGNAGEQGEVSELLKKYVRDGVLDRRKLLLELGDQLHYMAKIAANFDISLEAIMEANVRKLTDRYSAGKDEARELEIAETVLETHDFAYPVTKPQFEMSDTWDHDRDCPGD